MTDTSPAVLLVDGSPRGGGRTATVLRAVADGVAQGGGRPAIVGLEGELEPAVCDVLERAPASDAFVFASPTYRATYTAQLKQLLDRMPRGMAGEDAAPLRARACDAVLTGATLHHFLAVDSLRNVLAGFFGAYMLAGGLYVPHAGFGAGGELEADVRELAMRRGRALVALARAIAGSADLGALGPQV